MEIDPYYSIKKAEYDLVVEELNKINLEFEKTSDKHDDEEQESSIYSWFLSLFYF